METGVGALTFAAIAAFIVGTELFLRWALRCRHQNPHYLRPVYQHDPTTGHDVLVEPARYTCYDCGRTWRIAQRDPAWAPVHVRQVFSGHDERAAARAATRTAIVDEQRKILAANRSIPTRGLGAPYRPRRRRHASNVTDINSRRPA